MEATTAPKQEAKKENVVKKDYGNKQEIFQAKIFSEIEKRKTELQQLFVKNSEELKQKYEAKSAELQKTIQEEQAVLTKKYQEEGKKIEEDGRKEVESTQLKYQEQFKSNPFQIVTLMPKLQTEIIQIQGKYFKKTQDIQRETGEVAIQFQKDAMEKHQKLAKEMMVDQQELQKDFEQKQLSVQKEIEEMIHQRTAQLFQADPKYKDSKLSEQQIKEFIKNGYLKVSNVVPQDIVQAARKMVNYCLSQGFTSEELLLFRRPEVESCDQILALMNKTPLVWLARSMVGDTHPCYGGQLALRFPGFSCIPDFLDDNVPFKAPEFWEKMWHIDGLDSTENPIGKGKLDNFTILIGVLLADVESELCGNLCVFPGSHRKLEAEFKKMGTQSLIDQGEVALPKIDLGKPVQITGKAGDVVLLHYQTAHTVAPNISDNIRYAIYFRLHSTDHIQGQAKPECLVNIWKDWKNIPESWTKSQ